MARKSATKPGNGTRPASIGADEPLLGLTEKGANLDAAMRSVFEEFIVEIGPGRYQASDEEVEAVKRGFDRLWAEVGDARTALKTELLSVLRGGPRPIGEVMRSVGAAVEAFTTAEFKDAIRRMFDAGLLTTDPRRMWFRTV